MTRIDESKQIRRVRICSYVVLWVGVVNLLCFAPALSILSVSLDDALREELAGLDNADTAIELIKAYYDRTSVNRMAFPAIIGVILISVSLLQIRWLRANTATSSDSH